MKKIACYFLVLLLGCESLNQDSFNEIVLSKESKLENSESNLLHFANFNQIDDLLSKETEDLILKGMNEEFISFSQKAESEYLKAFNKAKNGEFKSHSDVFDYIEMFKQYIEIVHEENGDISIQAKNYNGYDAILNENRLVQIGENIYKAFD